MNILTDIEAALESMGFPVATGVYVGDADNYIVLTPLGERNDDIADDADLTETHDADVNLYVLGDYQSHKNTTKDLLKQAGFFISDRRYVAYEKETGHHHYVLTVEKKEVIG